MTPVRFCPNCGSCHSVRGGAPQAFPICTRMPSRCRNCGKNGHMSRFCYVVHQTLKGTLSEKEEHRLVRAGMREQLRRSKEYDSYKPLYTNPNNRRPIHFVKQLDLPIVIGSGDDLQVASKNDFEMARQRRSGLDIRPGAKESSSLRILLRLAIGKSPFKRAITVIQGSSLPCASARFMANLPAEVKVTNPQCWLDVRGERALKPTPGETSHYQKQLRLHELSTMSIAVVEVKGRVDCVVGTSWVPASNIRLDWLTLDHDLVPKEEQKDPPHTSNKDDPIEIPDDDNDGDLVMI